MIIIIEMYISQTDTLAEVGLIIHVLPPDSVHLVANKSVTVNKLKTNIVCASLDFILLYTEEHKNSLNRKFSIFSKFYWVI